jgi:hypothetical protein
MERIITTFYLFMDTLMIAQGIKGGWVGKVIVERNNDESSRGGGN